MKLVIFDMDGTIVNTGDAISSTINFVRNKIGLDDLKNDIILKNLNDPTVHSPRFFYQCDDYTPYQIELFESHYSQNCTKNIKLYDGIDSLLQKLHGKYKMCVATNAHTQFAHKILEHLEIKDYFDHIIGADMVQTPKPHPEMINNLIEICDTQKEHCIVIGDSLKDSMAAKGAGAYSITVNWGFTDHQENETIQEVKHLEQMILNF